MGLSHGPSSTYRVHGQPLRSAHGLFSILCFQARKSRPAPEAIKPKIIEATLLFSSHRHSLTHKRRCSLFNTFLEKVNRGDSYYWVWGNVADSKGKPVRDVQISFGLISLGQVGGDASSSMGTFRKDLPEGEYIAIPSKQGYAFEPESIKFHLFQMGYRMEFTAYPVP